ncbi:hypothetical protein QEN19_003871 [Hanseniaspora menglaensis]
MFNFGGNKTSSATGSTPATGFNFGTKTTDTLAAAPPAATPSPAGTGFSFGAKTSAPVNTGLSFNASTEPPANVGFGSQVKLNSISTAPTLTGFGAQPAASATTAAPTAGLGSQTAPSTTNLLGVDNKTNQQFLTQNNQQKSKIPQKSKINSLLDGCHLLPTQDSLKDQSSLSTLNVTITPSLIELCEATSLLNKKLSKVGDNLTRAHYLLSGSGFNVHEAEQFIDQLKKVSKNKRLARASKNINSRVSSVGKRNSSVSSNKIDVYLRDKKQENILTSIENSLNASENIPSVLDNEVYAQRKNDLKAHLGISSHKPKKSNTPFFKGSPDLDEFAPDSPNSTFTVSSTTRKSKTNNHKKMMLLQSFPNCKININSSQTQRDAFEEYAKIVYSHNSRKDNLEGESLIEMVFNYLNLNSENNQSNNRHLLECLEILKFHTGAEQKDLPLNKKSQSFLEYQFNNYIIDFYSKNSINEGLPSTVNKYIYYISSKLQNPLSGEWNSSNLTIVNNIPVWCIVYYLLRGGCVKEAHDYIISQKTIFNKICPQFSIYLKHFAKEGMLTSELQQRILLEYKLFKNDVNVDSYKLAVFKIIGKLDFGSNQVVSEVIESMEDWVWFHLAVLTKGVNEQTDIYKVRESSEHYTFQEFKELVVSLGEQQFGLKLYYQVLILTGLYENVAEYIADDKNRFNIDSVHLFFVIHDSLKLDYNQFLEIGLPIWKFFTSYMQSFIISDPKIVIEYLILFFKPLINAGYESNKSVLQLTQTLIKELIEYSKDYTAILGRVDLQTGVVKQGYLEKRASIFKINNGTDLYQKITEACALKAEEEGRFEDAILLYHLSNNLDSVFEIVNKTLGDFLSGLDYMNIEDCKQNFTLQNKDMNSILNKAILININFRSYSINSANGISKENKIALPVLLKIADIWQQYLSNDFAGTLDSLKALNLVPIYDTTANSIAIILTQGKELSELLCIDPVQKNLSNILILTMTCVQKLTIQLQNLKQQPEAVKEKTRNTLQQISKNCMTFVGITSYKLSKETYTILLSIESELYK